jgi:ferredoxin
MSNARPPETDAPPGARRGSTMLATGLSDLVGELKRRGYRVITPVARDGALVLDEIAGADELPFGVGAEQGPGRYRLTRRADRSVFANAVGPMPWKRFLRPPREKILDIDLGPDVEPDFREPDPGDEHLTGEHAERWLSWDSCFDLAFSHVHGGEVRRSAEARYRQWVTHKFGTWHDQFGTGGCVGCGRCIAWCPAGIDLTAELRALQQEWEQEANSE